MISLLENACPIYCRVDQLNEKHAYINRTLCHRNCSNQKSRAKTARVSSSSRRIHFRSFEVMSLTLAFPSGGPLNNCIPIVLGTIAKSTAQTGIHGQKNPVSVAYH